ncbi:hypothetical protein BJV78DRAFT_529135 [Lactifluus subvellereus]|nr:hypothetical protein BJV78DRAFT_529135 [Lactifluus subvellereus]
MCIWGCFASFSICAAVRKKLPARCCPGSVRSANTALTAGWLSAIIANDVCPACIGFTRCRPARGLPIPLRVCVFFGGSEVECSVCFRSPCLISVTIVAAPTCPLWPL